VVAAAETGSETSNHQPDDSPAAFPRFPRGHRNWSGTTLASRAWSLVLEMFVLLRFFFPLIASHDVSGYTHGDGGNPVVSRGYGDFLVHRKHYFGWATHLRLW